MNERLQQFLAAENISQSQFAETIGVARASVSHILAGRNRPGYDFICSLLEHYPSLNSEWILMGKGKMYKGAVEKAPVGIAPAGMAPASNYAPETAVPQQNTAVIQAPAPQPEPIQAPFEAHKDENGTMIQESLFSAANGPETAPGASTQKGVGQTRTISKIIILYSDNTFQELKG